VREEIRLLRQQVFAYGEPSREKLGEGLAVLQDSDLRNGLSSLQMPSLWIAGRRDRLVSPPAMQACAEMARQGRYARIEGGGHAPFLTHGDEVASVIRQFAQALPA
jgi:pimeloyl-[acyl-carrier protein] methyl ester esterase